jgi:signal transduction histidine kinase
VARAWLHRLALHQGRRGGILTLFGIAWIFCGLGFTLIPSERFSRPGPRGIIEFLDTPWPGLFWILCGLVALGNGLLRRRVRNEDAIGYAALIMPPGLWVLAYTASFTLWAFTRNNVEVYGRFTAILGALIFTVIVVILRIVANWPDDMDLTPVPPVTGSSELALLDRMVETREENTARGHRARADGEAWVTHSRLETEERIAESAAENDRMIAAAEGETERNRVAREDDQA